MPGAMPGGITRLGPQTTTDSKLMRDYRDRLPRTVDGGKFSLRSARLYLRAALGLVEATAARGLDRPDAAAARRR
ncbi:MAG: hypothetical protein ACYCX6_01750 [Vulcanimicrobiaceae bacterium]